jgi:hypothetical protein
VNGKLVRQAGLIGKMDLKRSTSLQGDVCNGSRTEIDQTLNPASESVALAIVLELGET